MAVSQSILQVIENNRSRLVNDLPVRQFTIDLQNENVFSDEDMYEIFATPTVKTANEHFIKILIRRGDEAFYKLCHLLTQNQSEAMQNWGKNLLQQTDKDNLLRGLPLTPESDYVSRERFNNTICDQLRRIDECGGHILVHGMAGSGKTVAVCQAVRQLIAQENYFNLHGCYWIKIGKISEQELVDKLSGLAIEIGISNIGSIRSLDRITSKIEKFSKDNTEMSNLLFIFDDIWEQEYYQYLTFAKKSIVTSRFNNIKNSNTYHCIPSPENLTYDEAIQLLHKRRNEDNTYELTNNVFVKNAIEKCKGLPLAISILSGLDLRTDDEWQNIFSTITNKDLKAEELLPDYNFNVFATFEFSIDQLNQRDQKLFSLLGVFKAEKIPIESIISLWGLQDNVVTTILKNLHRRSLLNFIDSNSPFCVLHDLTIEYLHQLIEHQQSNITLHQDLIDGYRKQCNGKWSTYPRRDYYYYQYLMHHAIQAKDDKTIKDMMRDFKWMNVKLQSDNTIYNLCKDIEKAIDYFRNKEIEICNQYQQLVQLLQRYESTLQIDSIDLVQVLLMLGYEIDWIKECALKLAKESDIEYWKIDKVNYNKVKKMVEPLKSKRIGKNKLDNRIAVSNLNYGNLRIVGTENNDEDDGCQIVIMDYETSKNIHVHRTPPQSFIDKFEISLDGHIVGFHRFSSGIYSWQVYNIDNNEKLYFMEDNVDKLQDQDFNELKFCPILHNNDIILATSDRNKVVKVWKIDGNKIRFINKQISVDYEIQSIKWIDNGSKIMLWWKMYECDSYGNLQDRNNWSNECQIQIWNLQSWHCLKSLSVPAYIIQKGNQYLPTVSFPEGNLLHTVHYINSNDECLILNYDDRCCGLLTLKNYDLKLWYDENALMNIFRPFPSFLYAIGDVDISSDQQFISCKSGVRDDVCVFKVVNGQLQSYIKIEIPHPVHHSLFIPESNRFLVYHYSHSLSEYVVEGGSLSWKAIKNEGNDDDEYHQRQIPSASWIIPSCYAYISNNPVGVQLINEGDTCSLKVLNFQQPSCPTQLHHTLDQKYNECYIFDDLQSAFVVQKSLKKVLMNFLSQNEDMQQHKTLWQYNAPNNVKFVKDVKLRYRKTDDTLVIVMEAEIDKWEKYFAIVTINLCNGQKVSYYKDEDRNRYWYPIYMDESYLITSSETPRRTSVQCYQIGDDTNRLQTIAKQSYGYKDRIACKITLPVNQSTGDLQFKTSMFKRFFYKKDWIECWGEKDGNVFVSKIVEDEDKVYEVYHNGNMFCMIEKGNDFVVLDEEGRVLSKGNNHKFEVSNAKIWVDSWNNLLYHKFWIVFNSQTKNIEMYEVATMKLYRILQFHYFDVWRFKWNQDQSSFIAFGWDGQYCVFNRV